MTRQYVRVLGEFDPNGNLRPVKIAIPDVGVFRVERVLDTRALSTTKAGGRGYRYSIMVEGVQSYIYFEPSGEIKGNRLGAWYIEQKGA